MALQELKSDAIARRNFLAPCLKFDDQKYEFLFVLDQSSSMAGKRIALAGSALVLFLRSLPQTCIFNVIGFNRSSHKLFPSSVQYDESNLKTAVEYASKMITQVGTRLIPPLQDIYRSAQTPGYLTQIFVLTDGYNKEGPDMAIQLVKANKPFARVFSLGIGSGASVPLVEGIAAEGGGVAEFVISPKEEIKTKVQELLKIALRPSLLKAIPLI